MEEIYMKKAKLQTQFSVSLPLQVISKIKTLAGKAEISAAAWIRKAIQNALQIDQKKEEIK
jgi:metal-responsive CopG/Arc/MetJ family transcriptional regulator